VEVLDVVEQPDVDGEAVARAECRVGDRIRWGAGRYACGLAAPVRAVLCAVDRAVVR
jgi:2-isopropylmalate synthase